MFWAIHFRQPIYYGNLAAYVQWKMGNGNRETSAFVRRKKRHK
jgi:hypothetical protein